jgi:hypothetical protein
MGFGSATTVAVLVTGSVKGVASDTGWALRAVAVMGFFLFRLLFG